MASYKLLIKPSAVKELEGVPLRQRRQLISRLARIEADPRPPECKKLTGTGRYRVKQGDYRAVYEVHDESLQEVVVKIGHRREGHR